MRPTKMTVYELFEKQRRYVVPLFQRPYVWNQEDQWEPLWDDILRVSEQQLERNGRPHFLGAVVLKQRDRFGRELDASDIIDGQQRLTTLQLALAAFRSVVRQTNERRLLTELQRLTTNDGLSEHEYEALKVWPTNTDRKTFEAVMKAESATAFDETFPITYKRKKAQPRERLVDAYGYFLGAISTFAAEGNGEQAQADRLYALFETFHHLLQLVVIELEKEDDPQVIFETLNARGAALLPSDLIRNFVFMRAARQAENADALYERHWKPFDERALDEKKPAEGLFWKKEERQGRILRPRSDLFFIHYLAYRLEREVSHTRLFDEFQLWWSEQKERKVADELHTFRRYSDVFATFFEKEDATRAGKFLRRLRLLDIGTAYPLLLFLLVEKREALGPTGLEQVLSDLESYLVRRTVCGLTHKGYNKLFPAIQRAVNADGGVATNFRARLLEADSEIARWPDDKEFERAWLTRPVYEVMKPVERVRMVLEALEQRQRTTKQERIKVEDDEVLSVEHIMPQKWRESWPTPTATAAAGGDDLGETPEERRDRMLHTFGNLTLLTTPLNSSVSNGPFSSKRPEIALHSLLTMNTVFQTASEWSEETIVERGRQLFRLATQVWPFPGPAA